MRDSIKSRFEGPGRALQLAATGIRGWSTSTPGAGGPRAPRYFPAGRYLVFSDIPNDRLLRYDETSGGVSVFRHPAGYANGHIADRRGRLVSCEHGRRAVTRTEADGSLAVLADRFDGKRLNSPNDLAEHSSGLIWFTDPSYGIDSDYEGHRSDSEIGACHVYRLDPATGGEQVTLAASRRTSTALTAWPSRPTSGCSTSPTARGGGTCGCSPWPPT